MSLTRPCPMQSEIRFKSILWHKGQWTLSAVSRISLPSCPNKGNGSGMINFQGSLWRCYCLSWDSLRVFSLPCVMPLVQLTLLSLPFLLVPEGEGKCLDYIIKLIEECIVGVSWVWLVACIMGSNPSVEICKLYCYVPEITVLFSLSYSTCFLGVLQDTANHQPSFPCLVLGIWMRVVCWVTLCSGDPG